MKQRCYDVSRIGYENYGGRGIIVCQRWMDFKNFLEDMGERPVGLTLDRKNGDLDYCKSNCRWATPKTQSRNKRTNLAISFNGKTQCLADWADDLGIDYNTLFYRIKHWPIEKAFTARIIYKPRASA